MKINISPTEIHTLKTLYDFFEKIQVTEWCQNRQTKKTISGYAHCAIGHLARIEGRGSVNINTLFIRACGATIPQINDATNCYNFGSPEGERAKNNVLTKIKQILAYTK